MAKNKKPYPSRTLFAFIYLFTLLIHHLPASASASPIHHHFEGFVTSLRSSPPPISLSTVSHPPSSDPINPSPDLDSNKKLHLGSASSFDYLWDEDEFEGIPQNLNQPVSQNRVSAEPNSTASGSSDSKPQIENSQEGLKSDAGAPKKLESFSVVIVCVTFLIAFAVNFFMGKRENENLALAWASYFAGKGFFLDNFSFWGVGENEDSPRLVQKRRNVYMFYASGRKFCSGLLAILELKSRHDLVSKLYNAVVPCRDEMTIKIYMNDKSMDHVVFALARKKLSKTMHKETRDLQRLAGLVQPPSGRDWVAEELQVISESKEVAGDLITDTMLDQVFGEKAFEKFGKGFISMHFSDQQLGFNKKMLVFKFALPDASHMADMTYLVALVPYYIDLIGKYKLNSHARSKIDAARTKVAQEIPKEIQNARQEAVQKNKVGRC